MKQDKIAQLIRLENGNYRIGIPVPFPMKYVYCYIMRNKSGYTVIDTGLNYHEARAAWEEVFNELEIAPSQIHTIILTHFHPDHSGLAGWMQQKTGADVWMSNTDWNMFQLAFMNTETQAVHVEQYLQKHGADVDLRNAILKNLEVITEKVQPFAAIKPITQKKWDLDNQSWHIIETPGHSQGHLCFYQETEGILIAGDMILDKITPNISIWPGGSMSPLQDYLTSLTNLKQLSAKQAWPGHGELIQHVNLRIDQLINHHQSRLDKIGNLADQKTGYAIAQELFAERNLNAHQWRFAISETVAHLEYLVDHERLNRINASPVLYEKK